MGWSYRCTRSGQVQLRQKVALEKEELTSVGAQVVVLCEIMQWDSPRFDYLLEKNR